MNDGKVWKKSHITMIQRDNRSFLAATRPIGKPTTIQTTAAVPIM